MSRLSSSTDLYISLSKLPKAGRGVFTKETIKKGAIIERCPVLEIPKQDNECINKTMLVEYVYYLGKNKDRLTLVLGFGSIYNHAYTPNASYKALLEEGVVEFIALKDIRKDEEITVNYNQDPVSGNKPLWFEDGSA